MKNRILLIIGVITLGIILLSISQTKAQKKDYLYHSLEISYISLQVADVYTTKKGLELGAKEGNPAAKWLIEKNLVIPAKAVSTFGLLYLLRRVRYDNPKMAKAYLIGANLLYGAVVYNNYRICVNLKI